MIGTRWTMATLLLPLLATASFASDSEVRLTVRTRDGQSVFQLGELIQLELSFTTSVPSKYQLTAMSNPQEIEIQPKSGWDNPLDLYSRSFEYHNVDGFYAELEEMSTEPTVVAIELNEWIRFKEPGQYRVAVNSGHVSNLNLEPVVVRSNELLLTIVPASSEWQQQALRDALAILD